jgi:hypothetical protein
MLADSEKGNIMKNITLKNKFVVVLLLITVGYTGFAFAFSMVGSKTLIRKAEAITPPPVGGGSAVSRTGALGAEAGATDVWAVVCPATTAWLETKVIDLNPVAAPLVSVQTIKGIKATNSTDPVDGDAAYSPAVNTTGTAGTFYVLVDKTSADAENYTVDIICKDANNVGLSTSVGVNPVQNN